MNEALQAHIDQLTLQLDQANERDRENRRIIAGLVQRVPELESPRDERDGRVTVSGDSSNGHVETDTNEPVERRSWWHRFFFGP